MNDFKKAALNILKQVKGSGKYVSTQIIDFVFPDLEINTIGELSFPINQIQAKALINVAQKAPFGIGHDTIIDTQVRSAWEIDSNQLTFKGNLWEKSLHKLLDKIKLDLGIENSAVSPHLYKMLIYESGDFFLAHRDSEKEKGMFGTMVITLPSKYTGGELIVKFDGNEESINFSDASAENKLGVAAFYADCEHQIKPLTSGYRVCLVYNLIQKKFINAIQLPSLNYHISQFSKILHKQIDTDNSKPIIVLLGHQYTPENFSLDGLKLNDQYKVDILLKAAEATNCYAKMCLVTSYKIGSPSYGQYYEDDNEDTEINEVIDESLNIEYWMNSNIPSFNEIQIEENDLVTSFALDEDEPIIKQNSGYMGNYGPDIEHWYHYGAVMIWSHETNALLMSIQNTSNQLEWIEYLSENLNNISALEIKTVEEILMTGIKQNDSDKNSNCDAIVSWIVKRKDEEFFSKISLETLNNYFIKISPSKWLELFEFLPEKNTIEIIKKINLDIKQNQFEQLLALLYTMQKSNSLSKLTSSQIIDVAFLFEKILLDIDPDKVQLSKTALENLFAIAHQSKQSEKWNNKISELLLKCTSRNYLNNVLLPILLEEPHQTALMIKTLENCEVHYHKITMTKPYPPENWTRQMPTANYHSHQWKILKSFIESPIEQIFEYRKPQQERTKLESAIKDVTIDLKTATIKKGSPHTLRITKTQDEFRRTLYNWEQDLIMLDTIIQRRVVN